MVRNVQPALSRAGNELYAYRILYPGRYTVKSTSIRNSLLSRSSLHLCPQHSQEDPADRLREAAAGGSADAIWIVQAEYGYVRLLLYANTGRIMLTVIDPIAEGDVEGVMDRPEGDSPEVQAEREKWYLVLLPILRCVISILIHLYL